MERSSRRGSAPVLAILVAALALVGSSSRAQTLCDPTSVLTLLAADTQTQRSLFAVSTPDSGPDSWVVLLDANAERARLLPDSLAGLRTGSSHGPGTFLSAIRCGEGCFQPLLWDEINWQRLGDPIHQSDDSTLHMTWDHGGAPWVLFHNLTEQAGVTDVSAHRWDGTKWSTAGRLRVQAVGSPAAAADPGIEDAVVSGSGRFRPGHPPEYWLPALPRSSGGQVIALARAAAFLTDDGRLMVSTDGGSTWLATEWTPWDRAGNPTATALPGTDYSIDRPTAAPLEALPILWYDERTPGRPALHLARWAVRSGWQSGPTIDLSDPSTPSVDHVLVDAAGRWTLLGACVEARQETHIEALVALPGALGTRRVEIPLERVAD